MKTVIGFVGLPGVGKSTAIEIAREYGPVVVMGDVVREEAKKRDLEITSETLGRVALDLRKKYGKMVIAQRCITTIQNLHQKTIILDGLRSMAEVNLFKKSFQLIIIAITVSELKRHSWLQSRQRADDSSSPEAIKKRDLRETEFGIQDVIAIADYQIENKGTIIDLQNKCKKLLEEITLND